LKYGWHFDLSIKGGGWAGTHVLLL